jgi:aspartyl-tRNA(Asn)/glutamyl-tRNA(Gln) amidotransferase subunit A
MQLFPSLDETIAGISHALKRRERTCVEVLERCLGKIDAWEERLHAWVSVDRDGALDAARSLDTELAHGNWRGPLHGIPVGIKDLVDVSGRPTAAGAPWLAGTPAADDALLVTVPATGGLGVPIRSRA